MPITDWPAADRPREKLLQHGAQARTDAELLALFLRIGVRGKTAVDLARELLTSFGGLNRLFATPRADFTAVHGMGDAKYAQLQAVLEMARRALGEGMREGINLATPGAVKDYLILGLGSLPHEVFCVLFLDAKHRLIVSEELFRGTLTQTSVYPREIVKRALAHNAAAVILAHNHPSGVAEPSPSDRMLTDAVKSALGLVDVRVLDHFVVAGRYAMSFAEQGWL